jgi:hypothetical protein
MAENQRPVDPSDQQTTKDVAQKAKRVLQFIGVSVMLTIVVGVAGNWAYNEWFAPGQDLRKQHAIEEANRQAEQRTAAAQASVEARRNDGGPWVSEQVIDLPIMVDITDLTNANGYPGDDRAHWAPGVLPNAVSGHDSLKLTLTSMRENTARIVSIKAVIDEQKPAPGGTVFYAMPQGTTSNDELAFDFSSNDLEARAISTSDAANDDDHRELHDRYFDLHTVTLAKGESVGYRIDTFGPTFDKNIGFHIEVTFDSGPPLEVYDNGKKLFRFVSYPRTAQRAYTYSFTDGHTGRYPCRWPQCMNNALQAWPFPP